ncbi:RnaseH-domain-containing protein [Flammula alnicola]|nr:RnaseH-domain-containing protein [Flammula alnicola]
MAGTIWFQEGDARNKTFKVNAQSHSITKGIRDTLAKLLSEVPTTSPLLIKTNLKPAVKGLTVNLRKNEEKGWTGTPDKESMEAMVALLRARQSQTSFEIVGKKENPIEVKKMASLLRATLEDDSEEIEAPENIPQKFIVTGMQITQATQATVYNRIMDLKNEPTRPATLISLDMARHAAGDLNDPLPVDKSLWMSIRGKGITPRARNFLWKAMHSAYKLGQYWGNIPNYEQRQYCHVCGNVDETMEHILTECRASGQSEIWKAAKELWTLRGLPWPEPTFGAILGSGARLFHNQNQKKPLPGANRLYRIIMSESAHLIWRTRCKWRIQDEGDPEKIPNPTEIWNKWISVINRRLQLECLQTNIAKYGRLAIHPAVVEKTWWAVLKDRGNLPDDWIRSTGVLVGIGRRPPGRNR